MAQRQVLKSYSRISQAHSRNLVVMEISSCKNSLAPNVPLPRKMSVVKGAFLMHIKLVIILLSSSLAFAGCSSSTTRPSANGSQTAEETVQPSSASSPASQWSSPAATETVTVKPKVDACALLTSKEIESVQGEAIKETKLTGQSKGGFSVSQCFFTLPNFTNSISLMVAQKGRGSGANDPKEFWRDTFHEDKAREKGKGRDKGKGEEEEEEGGGAPPQKIPGIGDEAYWTRSRVGGALYVLKGDAYIRISIGGAADQATKIKRSKVLAQKALARL